MMRETLMALVAGLAMFAAGLLIPIPANSQTPESFNRSGWMVHISPHGFKETDNRLKNAIKAEKMGRVTQASASAGAKGRGITIPGNKIIGVYRNDFAIRMLEASVVAGIEAPVRFYLTGNADGTTTLSYKTPTEVFSPYFDGAGDDLKVLAGELDEIFARIAARTVTN